MKVKVLLSLIFGLSAILHASTPPYKELPQSATVVEEEDTPKPGCWERFRNCITLNKKKVCCLLLSVCLVPSIIWGVRHGSYSQQRNLPYTANIQCNYDCQFSMCTSDLNPRPWIDALSPVCSKDLKLVMTNAYSENCFNRSPSYLATFINSTNCKK